MKGLTIVLGKMEPPSREKLEEMQKLKGKEKPEAEDEEECEDCGESPCECEDKPTMPTTVTGSH